MKLIMVLALSLLFSCSSSKTKDDGKDSTPKSKKEKQIEEVSSTGTDETAKAKTPTDNAQAEATSSSEQGINKVVTCSFVQETRTVAVQPMEPRGCKVIYTKYGAEQEVGNAMNDTSICHRILKKITNNLTKAGFVCK
jgi:LAS superfamily LD-carboxypeptidase LdcB